MKSTMLVGISLTTPSPSGSSVGVLRRRRLDHVDAAVEHHPRRGDDARARLAAAEVGVGGLQTHLGVEGADQELADGDRPAVQEERPHAEVGVDAPDARGVDGAGRGGR